MINAETHARENPLLPVALSCREVGISIVPPTEDGEKRPISSWKQYQVHLPSRAQILRWYSSSRSGIGVITGKVSGNLEVLDFDTHETYAAFLDLASAAGCEDLIERLRACYEERTPNGAHLAWHCERIAGNTKLAKRPLLDAQGQQIYDERGNPEVKTLIETKGEGGFVIMAPSNGKVHPSGRPYVLLQGSIATIATITPDERAEIFALCRAFNEIPEKQDSQRGEQQQQAPRGDRPGDHYNATASWEEVLAPKGWVKVYTRNGETYWRRPGKDRGISATTNYNGSDLLYVFSTSTPFEAERGHSKFAAYTLLNHNGDFKKAAEALSRAGTGHGWTHARYRNYEHETEAAEDDEDDGVVPPAASSVEPFPLEALPGALGDLIRAGAQSLHCPADFLAIPTLTHAGAAIGTSYEIEIKRGWRERPCLYTAVVAPPGTKKARL